MQGLAVKGINVRYGQNSILKELSLPLLAAGEVTVLAGPNAAGKSTLLRALAHVQPYRGEITLNGTDLGKLSGAKRAELVGYMPQTLPASADLTVIESLIAALNAAGGHQAKGDERALATLERLGIAPLALRNLRELSGGQRQMVSLGQAIIRNPSLLLLDEPTSALDLARQVRLLSELRRLAGEGRAVLVVLHDLSLAARWADRIAVLDQGRLHSFGRPAEVLTPEMLANVYGVEARIEACSRGHLTVHIDAGLTP